MERTSTSTSIGSILAWVRDAATRYSCGMDFGAAAPDYARHRAGFPPSFFARVAVTGRMLDLGSGTGTLARGFAAQGAQVVAVDRSAAMLAQATDLPLRVAA